MNTAIPANDAASLADLSSLLRQGFEHLSEEAIGDIEKLLELYRQQRDPEVLETITELFTSDSCMLTFKPGASEAGRTQLADYQKNMGSVIRSIRMQRQWSQQYLAKLSGLKQSHISRLEKGMHTPSDLTIQRLAEALEVPPAQIDPSL